MVSRCQKNHTQLFAIYTRFKGHEQDRLKKEGWGQLISASRTDVVKD